MPIKSQLYFHGPIILGTTFNHHETCTKAMQIIKNIKYYKLKVKHYIGLPFGLVAWPNFQGTISHTSPLK